MPRLLIADDSSEFATWVSSVLEEAGYEVTAAGTGTDAIRQMERGGVDAAVLDVLMPGMSGDVIAERLRRIAPRLPVLLMTGAYGTQYVKGVPAPVLRKPFTEEQLVEAVQKLVGPAEA